MKLHEKEMPNDVLDGMLNLAINKLGFTNDKLQAQCDRIYHTFLLDETKKIGKFVYATEFITHEVCHLLIEEGIGAFNKENRNSSNRSFTGQINELKTVALASIFLEQLYPVSKNVRWSRKRRCLETFLNDIHGNKNPEDILTTVEYMMPDMSLRRMAQVMFINLIKKMPTRYYSYVPNFEF